MSTPLLSTKLHFPDRRPKQVSREHLLRRLNDQLIQGGSFSRKLTLIAAPAGYGKTTLAADWLSALDFPAAWLSLDTSDNDPARFLQYLITALQQVRPDVGREAREMLRSSQAASTELILTALINDLDSIPAPFTLALDDYHTIQTPEIHHQLTFMLDHQPARMHMVITTREDPLLPVARLRARGQAAEIRQEDLRFTSAEVSRFLGEVMGLSLTPEEIGALDRRTEGWIAGLQLAALSLQGRNDVQGFIEAFTGSSRFVLDYLIEEVFALQTQETQDFLLRTSVLERLSGPLCDAVTDSTGSSVRLQALEEANLFIVPLDPSRTWYRYHRLFAELLRHRLRTLGDVPEMELHIRASGWYAQNGLFPEAIGHALAAEQWEAAGEWILRTGTDLLKRGEVATMLRWYQAFPEDAVRSNPRLSFEFCWPLLLAGHFEKAGPLLDHVEQFAQQSPAFLGEVLAARAYLARGLGDHAGMMELSHRALGLIPAQSIHSRGLVAFNLGLAYWHMGDMEAAEEALAEAEEAARATDNTYMLVTTRIFQGRVQAVKGNLREAAGIFRGAIDQGTGLPVTALAHLDLAVLQYEWNDLSACETHLEKAIDLCRRGRQEEFLAACLMFEARLRLAQGHEAAAKRALDAGRSLVKSGRLPEPIVMRMDAAQAIFDLARNGEEAAREWAEKLDERTDSHDFYRFLGVTKGRLMAAAGDRVKAQAYLAGLYEAASRNGWIYGTLAVRVWQAWADKDTEQALVFLEDALRVAEEEGFVRTIAEGGEAIVPLLHEAARRGTAPEFAGKVLTAIGALKEHAAGALPESLSEREVEVLRLVTAGLTNREIAEKLFISIGTAKTHVHNLCGKLGVRNRVEAAARARELNLV